MKLPRAVLFLLLSILAVGLLVISFTKPAKAQEGPEAHPVPVLAYYYIWFDTGSWDRAKTDYPLLGRYSSDNREVMLQHIRWAKAAGIDGFIVSWKSTEPLNRRLDMLVELAGQEDFKLVIIYQGLDFYRNPLPVDRIARDLTFFTEQYSGKPAFQLFAKPLVIWSGTWKFNEEEIARVTQSRRDALLLLSSERNNKGYERLKGLVDGNAYYWSSVNPETFPGYPEKLIEMGEAVHADGGIWIAPAAPGFDARLVGGTSVVERNEGDTFRLQINTAMASSPDAVGIISWNEFSENSHIEPSEAHGAYYLDVLSEINHLPPPVIGEFDSSEPAAEDYPLVFSGTRAIALGGVGLLFLFAFFVIVFRRL